MTERLSNISAHIPEDLAKKLQLVSDFEERPKSYYIKKGLTEILEEKFRDMNDYLSARKTLEEAKAKNEFVSFEKVFKGIK
jgi:predicted DNA-binding protein